MANPRYHLSTLDWARITWLVQNTEIPYREIAQLYQISPSAISVKFKRDGLSTYRSRGRKAMT